MKTLKLYTTLSVCGLLISSFFSSPAFAEPEIKTKHSVKGQYIFLDNDDLDSADASGRSSQSVEYKATVYGDINDDWSFFTEARALKNFGEAGSIDSETGEATGRDDFVELRRLWVEYSGLAEYLPFSIRVGRQRIREERALWWNRDLDAVSLIYDATLFTGLLTVGENLMEYRSTGDAFNEDDQKILRILGETSWQWRNDHFLEARVAWQDDHSGINDVGYTLRSEHRDDEDSDLLWFGARAKGDLSVPNSGLVENIKYRADIMGLTGEQENETTTPNADGTRTVTGMTDQDVRGWATDLSADITIPVGRKPILSLGYAFGSGDSDPTDDDIDAFRQTGLDGNTSRLVGSSSSFYNYGSVLRPDLSNIHIVTAGLGVPVLEGSQLGTIYHYYRLDDESTSIPTSGVSAPLSGTDADLGHGVDVVLDMDVSQELDIHQKGFDRIGLKTTLGGFFAGDAYGAGEGETAFRAQVDLSLRF